MSNQTRSLSNVNLLSKNLSIRHNPYILVDNQIITKSIRSSSNNQHCQWSCCRFFILSVAQIMSHCTCKEEPPCELLGQMFQIPLGHNIMTKKNTPSTVDSKALLSGQKSDVQTIVPLISSSHFRPYHCDRTLVCTRKLQGVSTKGPYGRGLRSLIAAF